MGCRMSHRKLNNGANIPIMGRTSRIGLCRLCSHPVQFAEIEHQEKMKMEVKTNKKWCDGWGELPEAPDQNLEVSLLSLKFFGVHVTRVLLGYFFNGYCYNSLILTNLAYNDWFRNWIFYCEIIGYVTIGYCDTYDIPQQCHNIREALYHRTSNKCAYCLPVSCCSWSSPSPSSWPCSPQSSAIGGSRLPPEGAAFCLQMQEEF